MADTEEKFRALLAKGYKLADIRAFVQQRQAEQGAAAGAALRHNGPGQDAPGPWADGFMSAEPREEQLKRRLTEGQAKVERLKAEPGPSFGDVAQDFGRASRSLGSDYLDTLSFGGYRKARDAVLPDSTVKDIHDDEAAAAEMPGMNVARGVVKGIGYATPAGAPLLAAKVGQRLASAGSLLPGLKAGLGTGATIAAGESAVRGDAPGDIAENVAAGAALGGGIGAVGDIGVAGMNKLRDPRSLTGRTTNSYNEAQREGVFDKPEFQALPSGKEGYNLVADDVGQKFTKYNQEQLQGLRKRYGADINEVVNAAGDKAVGLEGLHGRLGELQAENVVNDVPVDESLNGAIGKVKRMLTKKTGVIASDNGEEITANAGTLKDVLRTKKAVQDMAEFGQPVTAENRPYRLIYKELAQEAEAIDPTGQLKDINRRYGEGISKLERANDIVYGREVPEIAGRAPAERTAAARFGRLGDDTTAGTVGARQLDELASMDPEYARMMREVEYKKAYERTRFGLPRMSKSPEKWASLGALDQNWNALATRALDPAASAAAEMQGAAPAVTPGVTNAVTESRRREREREKARSERAKRGQ